MLELSPQTNVTTWWVDEQPTPICLSFCPTSASFCRERQRNGLLSLYSLRPPKLTTKTITLNLKPVLYCIDIPKHSHSNFFSSPLLLLTPRTCGCFSLKHIFFKTVMGIFSHCKFAGEHFASSLFVVWFVPFLMFSDLWKSTLIHKEFHILVKSELKLQTLAGALSQVRIIVRKPRVFIWVPPKAGSGRQGFGCKDLKNDPRKQGKGVKKMKQRR